jgi:hypothetical protein
MSLKSLADYDRVPGGKLKESGSYYGALGRSMFKSVKKKKRTSRRGKCAECNLTVKIKANGHTWKHASGSETCIGSGTLPSSIGCVCRDCGRKTAYTPLTYRIDVHSAPLTGHNDPICPSSGYKVVGVDSAGRVILEP